MRSLTTFSKGLLAAGLLAGSLLSGCGPDYSLFKVTVVSTNAPNRGNIVECRMTITDGDGKAVVGAVDGSGHSIPTDGYLLQSIAGPADTSNNPTLLQGCGGNMTPAKIGVFSYSTSRTTGTLVFQVDGLDSFNNVVQTGTSSPATPAKFPPEVEVAIAIK